MALTLIKEDGTGKSDANTYASVADCNSADGFATGASGRSGFGSYTASRTTGIPASRMLISATHTHTAPTCGGVFQSDPDKDYQQFLAARIADGVQCAVNNPAPARIGWSAGQAPGETGLEITSPLTRIRRTAWLLSV